VKNLWLLCKTLHGHISSFIKHLKGCSKKHKIREFGENYPPCQWLKKTVRFFSLSSSSLSWLRTAARCPLLTCTHRRTPSRICCAAGSSTIGRRNRFSFFIMSPCQEPYGLSIGLISCPTYYTYLGFSHVPFSSQPKGRCRRTHRNPTASICSRLA